MEKILSILKFIEVYIIKYRGLKKDIIKIFWKKLIILGFEELKIFI